MAAQTSGTAIRSGYGQLSVTEAEKLVLAGVNPDTAAQGFGRLVQSSELIGALAGMESSEDQITREEQLGAAFTGDAIAQRRIQRRAEMRVAAIQRGGDFVATREGFVGLGSANT